jgi:hypothetical protein
MARRARVDLDQRAVMAKDFDFLLLPVHRRDLCGPRGCARANEARDYTELCEVEHRASPLPVILRHAQRSGLLRRQHGDESQTLGLLRTAASGHAAAPANAAMNSRRRIVDPSGFAQPTADQSAGEPATTKL